MLHMFNNAFNKVRNAVKRDPEAAGLVVAMAATLPNAIGYFINVANGNQVDERSGELSAHLGSPSHNLTGCADEAAEIQNTGAYMSNLSAGMGATNLVVFVLSGARLAYVLWFDGERFNYDPIGDGAEPPASPGKSPVNA